MLPMGSSDLDDGCPCLCMRMLMIQLWCHGHIMGCAQQVIDGKCNLRYGISLTVSPTNTEVVVSSLGLSNPAVHGMLVLVNRWCSRCQLTINLVLFLHESIQQHGA